MNLELTSAMSLLTEKLKGWYEILVKSIPNILVAVVVFLLFVALAKLMRKGIKRFLPNVTHNVAVTSLVQSITYMVVLIIGLFISLEIMHLDKTVTSILAGAGVIGLALGFAFQEIASNFVSGIFIAFREPYQVGDIVKINDYMGEVIKVKLRTTSIMTFDGLEVIIPNKYMFTEPFTNYTTTANRRLEVSVGISYGDDLDLVEKITKKALNTIDERLEHKDVEVWFQEFGSSSINLSARVWIKYPNNGAYLKAKHQVIKNIKGLYDENNISIPFPIRTIDLGIKGGESLREHLPKMSSQLSN